jgi:ABC-type multidrug transport system permease subunit
MSPRDQLRMVWSLMRRGVNEIVRVPGAAIPGVLAPTIFILGLTSVFGKLTLLPGFSSDDYLTFILPVGFLQGAGFTGAATGVNLARDIEVGWFDRLLASPAPRHVLLAGTIFSASLRALMPITLLITVGLCLGAHFPGIDGLLLAILFAVTFASITASYSMSLALKFKTQAAAPLMQAGVFMAVLFTTSYAPQSLLTGWLHDVAKYNPVTQIVEGVRQGFVGGVSWADTWPAILALAGLLALVGTLALRGLNRAAD